MRTPLRALGLGLAATCAAALVVPACAGGDGAPAAVATTSVPTTIDPQSPLVYAAFADPSTPIYMAIGRRFALSLEADPAQGVRWQATADPDPAIVRSLGTEFRPAGTDPGQAVPVQLLHYAAAGEGETTVTVTLVSADGQPVPGRESLTFTIVVSLSGEPPPLPPPPDDTAPSSGEGDEDDGGGGSSGGEDGG